MSTKKKFTHRGTIVLPSGVLGQRSLRQTATMWVNSGGIGYRKKDGQRVGASRVKGLERLKLESVHQVVTSEDDFL